MPEILNCLIKIFADKPTVYTAVQFDEHRRLLENSVDQLVQRTKDLQLKFNNECKILHVGKNNPELKYFMDGRKLQCIEIEKDLGVLVDKDREFDFEQHINETVKKEDKTVGKKSK